MEDLLASHRKQLRDLQSVITQKKKNATKKTRKGVNDDCDRLERELTEKQADEIAALEKESNPDATTGGGEAQDGGDGVEDVAEKLEEARIDDTTTDTVPTNHDRLPAANTPAGNGGPKKQNRQKARLARRQAQIEEVAAEAAKEAASQPDLRAQEAERMAKLFEDNGLSEVQIAPDGHCLYSAFAVGLEDAGIELSDSSSDKKAQRGYTYTRKAAGEYMKSHPDDFTPFLEEGESLDDHVHKVTSTAEWGGQMELLALAKEYGVTVKVVQATGQGVTSMNDDEGKKADVWLAYHRRGYGLGEHYNALRKKS